MMLQMLVETWRAYGARKYGMKDAMYDCGPSAACAAWQRRWVQQLISHLSYQNTGRVLVHSWR